MAVKSEEQKVSELQEIAAYTSKSTAYDVAEIARAERIAGSNPFLRGIALDIIRKENDQQFVELQEKSQVVSEAAYVTPKNDIKSKFAGSDINLLESIMSDVGRVRITKEELIASKEALKPVQPIQNEGFVR